MRIHTIGYERASFPDFAATLVGADVTSVIDVRAAPHSRRREFAFKHLGPELAAYGIGYESWPALGTPAEGRAAAKRGDMVSFGRIFEAQLASDAGQAALDVLVERMPRETLCLMCYERDPAQCHRTLIVERLRDRVELEVCDLIVGESDS